MTTKTCGLCREDLPVTEFYRRTDSPDGLQGRCKECSTLSTREWKRNHTPAALKERTDRARKAAVESAERFREEYPEIAAAFVPADEYRDRLKEALA